MTHPLPIVLESLRLNPEVVMSPIPPYYLSPSRETAIGVLLELCDWIVDEGRNEDIEDIIARASAASDVYREAVK